MTLKITIPRKVVLLSNNNNGNNANSTNTSTNINNVNSEPVSASSISINNTSNNNNTSSSVHIIKKSSSSTTVFDNSNASAATSAGVAPKIIKRRAKRGPNKSTASPSVNTSIAANVAPQGINSSGGIEENFTKLSHKEEVLILRIVDNELLNSFLQFEEKTLNNNNNSSKTNNVNMNEKPLHSAPSSNAPSPTASSNSTSSFITLPPECELMFFENKRLGICTFRGKAYPLTLVDLPAIIESHKTFDHKRYYKTADISQMLIIGQLPEAVNRRLAEEGYAWPDGITNPLKEVRRRRFRKRASKKVIEDIEAEVRRLLEKDAQAISVEYKVTKEEEDYDDEEDQERDENEDENEHDDLSRLKKKGSRKHNSSHSLLDNAAETSTDFDDLAQLEQQLEDELLKDTPNTNILDEEKLAAMEMDEEEADLLAGGGEDEDEEEEEEEEDGLEGGDAMDVDDAMEDDEEEEEIIEDEDHLDLPDAHLPVEEDEEEVDEDTNLTAESVPISMPLKEKPSKSTPIISSSHSIEFNHLNERIMELELKIMEKQNQLELVSANPIMKGRFSQALQALLSEKAELERQKEHFK